ncbi:MAG: DUF4906 domain-containing protein [Bacteroidales bacterium]|nr:DUF4906 domain-containing protein [Bacteroidales bacterium]
MKQVIRIIISAIIASQAIWSCADEICTESPALSPSGNLEECATGTMAICTDILESTVIETRSILPEKTIETMVTGITIAAYSGGLLADKMHYTSGFENMSLSVNKSGTFNIYALVNMGDMTGDIPVDESGIDTIAYTVASYSEVESSGIPMCGAMKGVPYSEEKVSIPTERLFAKLCVRILHTGLNATENNATYVYNLCNKSIYVRQANSRIFPFSSCGSRAISISDTMEESDYNADLNSRNGYQGSLSNAQLGPGPGYFQDTTLVFYIPENMQGTLLPGNSDPYSKTSENISGINGTDYSGLCTYLEFTAKRENTGIGYGGSITYRYYLGSDSTADFNIERNCRYDLTLNFSEGGFFMESWKVAKGNDWYDNRVLKFMEKPYIVYRGYTKNVMVHYHTALTGDANSMEKPDGWSYVFDEKAIADAGLTYSFDRNTLVTGANGYKDFCFVFKASESAKSGQSIPLKIVSWDGSLSDYTTIHIAEPGDIEATWDFCPMYVSQEGTVTISGIPDSQLPLRTSFSDPSVASLISAEGNRLKIAAKGTGSTVISVSDKDGRHCIDLNLSIQAPVLKIMSSYIAANPDGAPFLSDFIYTDKTGEELRNTNAAIFNLYLRPVISGNEFFEAHNAGNRITAYIKKLYDSTGKQIDTGTEYTLEISAVQCPEVAPATLSIYVVDPFAGIVPRHYGKIDDYSLFTSASVDTRVREYFMDDIESNRSFTFEAPVPNAAKEFVSAAMTPCWRNYFSNANETFRIRYVAGAESYSSGAAFMISQGIADNVQHSAGRHDIMLNVTNRHSSESISTYAGTVDVYVHTAIGASAEFGYRSGSYMPAGCTQTFAEVYNGLMPNPALSANSIHIYYMDVSVEYLTDISGIYVFSRMASGTASRQNTFDCLDIVRPSVSDKEVLQRRLLCSVFDNEGGTRITVCGEPYGYRRGIGKMLYRAILFPGRDASLTLAGLKTSMLGYISESQANSGFAPQYHVHDMNRGSDMAGNIVTRKSPYYFSPVQCSQYTDSQGRGYHVIHFLDEIAPWTCGWTNLL